MGLNIFNKLVVYITYNMGNRDLPDIYALARGPHIYQANPSCPCYNYYVYYRVYYRNGYYIIYAITASCLQKTGTIARCLNLITYNVAAIVDGMFEGSLL